MSAKRALTGFRSPDEQAAEERVWEVVSSVYQQHTSAGRRRFLRRPAAGLAGVVVMAGALALSPAGATIGRLIDRALGVQHAALALFSLPAPGRLLVSGSGGTWTVSADGSARRIGPWSEASWSPHGRYLAVTATNEPRACIERATSVYLVHLVTPGRYRLPLGPSPVRPELR